MGKANKSGYINVEHYTEIKDTNKADIYTSIIFNAISVSAWIDLLSDSFSPCTAELGLGEREAAHRANQTCCSAKKGHAVRKEEIDR